MDSLDYYEHRDEVLQLIEETQQLLSHICQCYHALETINTQHDLVQAVLLTHDVFVRLDRYALYLLLQAKRT